MPRCEYLRGYDSFQVHETTQSVNDLRIDFFLQRQGSEAAYIYGIIYLAFFPVFCVCAGYGVIKLNNGRRRRAKNNQPDTNCFGHSLSDGNLGAKGVGLGGVGGKAGVRRKKSAEEKKICAREWLEPGRSSRPVLVNLGPQADVSLTNRLVQQ